MSLIARILNSWDGPVAARQAALERCHADPGIPSREGTTQSFWLKDEHPAINTKYAGDGVSNVDVVIIGSGITGLSVAHTILTEGDASKPLSVMMLEARDVCTGATGRNGGHLLETVGEYKEFKEAFGQADAMKLIRFRRGHFDTVDKLLGANSTLRAFCQFRGIEFVSAYYDKDAFDDAVENIEEFIRDMPEEAQGFAVKTGSALAEEYGLSPSAVGAIVGPAGAVWPYRLVTSVLDGLASQYPSSLFIRTRAPVSCIEVSQSGEADTSSPYTYTLTTPAGVVHARHVVHCTNGHIGHLVPGLRGRCFPLRGQMSAQQPGAQFPSQGSSHSWVFNYAQGFDYLTQLPGGDPDSAEQMMFGGGLASHPHAGVGEIGVATDDQLTVAANIHLRGAMSAAFAADRWGPTAGVQDMWTGIMGFTLDNFPWVGELPESLTKRPSARGKGREWTAAGFCGEGMVQAWGSGKAAALMLLKTEGLAVSVADEYLDNVFPAQMAITEKRIATAVLPTVPKALPTQ